MGCIANESNFNSCKSKEEIVSSIKDMIKLLNSNMRDYISMKHEGKIQALQKIMSDSEEIIVLLKNSEKDFEMESESNNNLNIRILSISGTNINRKLLDFFS